MENSDGHRISSLCSLCQNPVDPHDPDTWKQVRGWVGGPRKDSMRLREDTGYFAHNECVAKVQSGQAADQESLLDEVSPSDEAIVGTVSGTDTETLEGLLHD